MLPILNNVTNVTYGTIMVHCKDCKFKDNQGGKKYCHRFPPIVISDQPAGPDRKSVFPEIDGNWFCGEGVLKEAT